MISLQLKQKLTPAVLALTVLAIIGVLIQLLSYSWSSTQSETLSKAPVKQPLAEPTVYIEKIDDFVLQVFNTHQTLSHFVRAKRYFNFKDAPALLLEPQVTTYTKQGKKNYNLTAQRAYYLHNGDIKFQGKVDIRSHAGVTHKINTEALIVATDTDELFSNKKVVYLSEDVKIESLGLRLQTQNDKLLLSGEVRINQDSGQKIRSKNLIIDKSNGKEHYYSNKATQYLTNQNTIYANGGMDMDAQKQTIRLLGKTKILHYAGAKINTRDLMVDQSNGRELYHTKAAIHYQNGIADIRAIGMHYDARHQTIKLIGGVTGRYE